MPRIQRHTKARGRDYYLDPPAYQRAPAVEELDHGHPGLQKFVEEQLAAATSMRKIETMVQEKLGIRLPARTVGEFRLKRWLPKRRRIEAYEEMVEARLRVADRHGDDSFARGQLVESLIKAHKEVATMRPDVAMRRQLGYLKLDLERQKVAVTAEKVARDRKEVELATAKFRAEQAERRKRRRRPSAQELSAALRRAMGVQGRLVPRVEPEGQGDDHGSF